MNNKKFTYKKSGVNIKAADKFVDFISSVSSKKKGKKKFSNIGGFGSISKIPSNIKQPQIVACTDGVGTKIEIANSLNKFDTIGIDLVGGETAEKPGTYSKGKFDIAGFAVGVVG